MSTRAPDSGNPMSNADTTATRLERALAELSFQSSLVAMNAALRAENSQEAVAPLEVLVRNARGSIGGKISPA